MPKPSLKSMKKAFPNLTFRLTDGEYRVNFRGGKEATAYYTTDADDAFGTATIMSRGVSKGFQSQMDGLLGNPKASAKEKSIRTHQNPRGLLWGSPSRKSQFDGATIIGAEVYEIKYRHGTDGQDYVHAFETPVIMLGLPDGRIVFESSKGLKLWEVRNV